LNREVAFTASNGIELVERALALNSVLELPFSIFCNNLGACTGRKYSAGLMVLLDGATVA